MLLRRSPLERDTPATGRRDAEAAWLAWRTSQEHRSTALQIPESAPCTSSHSLLYRESYRKEVQRPPAASVVAWAAGLALPSAPLPGSEDAEIP